MQTTYEKGTAMSQSQLSQIEDLITHLENNHSDNFSATAAAWNHATPI